MTQVVPLVISRRDETIQLQEGLINTLKVQREEDQREIAEIKQKVDNLEQKLQFLQGEFATDIVTAIFQALPAVIDGNIGTVGDLHKATEAYLNRRRSK